MNCKKVIESIKEEEQITKAQLSLNNIFANVNLCGDIFSNILKGKEYIYNKYILRGIEQETDIPNLTVITIFDGIYYNPLNLYEDNDKNFYITYTTLDETTWKAIINSIYKRTYGIFKINRILSDMSSPSAKKVLEWVVNDRCKFILTHDISKIDDGTHIISLAYQVKFKKSMTPVNEPSKVKQEIIPYYYKLIPFPHTTLQDTLQNFKDFFIKEMRQDLSQYENIKTKIVDSKKVKELIGSTMIRRTPPHAEDLIYIASSMFLLKFDLRYTALIALMVLKYWNDNANDFNSIASQYEVNNIANNVLMELSSKLK